MKLDSDKYHRNKEVSPWRIFYILIAINFFLFLFVLLFPNSEYTFGDSLRLQFVSVGDLFNPPNRVVVDLDSVLADMEIGDTSNFDQDIFAEADSLVKEPELNKRIQYSEGRKNVLYNFFEALLALEKGEKEVFRILHYGDSQLEGDRISDYLRNKFQLRFGGEGPGIVLPIDVSKSRISILQSESRDWKKYAIYGNNRHPEGIYGIGGASFEYSGTISVRVGSDTIIRKVYDSLVPKMVLKKTAVKDTQTLKGDEKDTSRYKQKMVPFDSSKYHFDTIIKGIYERRTTEDSWLKFKCANQSYPKVRTFKKVELLYKASDSCFVSVNIDGAVIKKTLLPFNGLRKIVLFEGQVNSEVLLRFTGSSPLVFAVFLDGDRGIAVDNFPMRGSSGTGYELINRSLYAQQLEKANTRLIIMQYGINVVPNPTSNYDYYERLFYNQLKAIKAADPTISILVIGPSDMSRKVGGEYVSYPNITKIRDAMRNAAFKSDCAFWDLYESMGGQNSMVSWVQNSPSLASKDFTHFNARGARFVGEMLYDALMSQYIEWKKLKVLEQGKN